MKLPSWTDFNKGLSKFEQEIEVERSKISDKIQDLKDAHPVLDKIIKGSLGYLPPPFNEIAKTIYDSFENTKKDIAIEEVLKFLHDIRKEGEEQYKEIAFKLDIIKDDMAKQETLLLIRDFLVNKDSPINKKLDEILRYVKEYKEKPLSPQQAIIAPHPKPKTFHGEKPIFVGRQNYLEQIKEYFRTSNDPITIFGMEGMGKSSLAFEAIHQSEDIFDLIIPIYFAELGISLNSFLSSIAKTLNISLVDFDKLELQDRKQFLIDTLGRSYTHPLIFVDNYETISGVLKDNPSHAKYNEAVQINSFLKRVPSNNTSILLTSRLRKNLDKERVISIDSLTIDEGVELFIKLAGDEEMKRSTKSVKTIEKLVEKTGGHPLSIEILSRSYQGAGLEEIEGMLNHLGIGEYNREEEQERLRSLGVCFEYSINNLDENLRQLLPKLILFKSPFPSSTTSQIFDTNKLDIINLYNRSLLVRIELDEYGKINEEHVLYNFHPALRNYLENEVTRRYYLEITYGEKFSQCYSKLLQDTYHAIGKETHVLSMRRFNLIIEGENNDFDRAIELTKDPQLRSYILVYLGLILQTLGMLTTAHKYHEKALAIHEELNDKVGLALDYRNIGIGLRKMGNLKEALGYHKKALAIHEELNDKVGIAGDYANIGIVFRKTGNLKERLESFSKGLEKLQEFEKKTGYHHPLIERLQALMHS
jgi:tetratricopeptide (TPR) repeat protein